MASQPHTRCVLLGMLACLWATSAAHGADTPPVEKLIDQLQEIKDSGFGYSPTIAGSQFLPRTGSSQMTVVLLGREPPRISEAMTALVRLGAKAIPDLIKHLDDSRATKIPPVAGMMFTGWDDEYDYNRRTNKVGPKGVNRDSFNEQHHPKEHRITVGDLCFVALGQIVNRQFSAARYQPTGGMIISSPTYSKALLEAARAEYSGMTEERLKQQLVADFRRPDSEFRLEGAAMRLAFYYPSELDTLVVAKIQAPTFDVFRAEKFVREVLYKEKDPAKRKALFDAHISQYGAAEKDGVLLQLFSDLDLQIAAEEGRLSPPLKPKHHAREALVELYGYPATVKEKDKPYVDTMAASELARFIEALGATGSAKINDVIYQLFIKIDSDDYLAVACMKALMGSGHDKDLIAYCQRRVKKSQYEAEELQQMLNQLRKAAGKSPSRK